MDIFFLFNLLARLEFPDISGSLAFFMYTSGVYRRNKRSVAIHLLLLFQEILLGLIPPATIPSKGDKNILTRCPTIYNLTGYCKN